jgi:phage-related protein
VSDIYVFSSNDNTNDYSTMGLVGALTPKECTFKETANGESIVELTHPLDSFGRYTALQRGNILAVPVPVRTTPEIQNGEYVTDVWTYKLKPLSQLTSAAQRTLYMWRFSDSPKVALLQEGDEVTVTWKANENDPASGDQEDNHPWKVRSKYGEGWVVPDSFELVKQHDISGDANSIQEVQSPWTVTTQYFRIYETQKSIDEIAVSARHISYDLLYNLTNYRNGFSTSLQDILDGVLNGCYAQHQFSAYTTLEGDQSGNYYDDRNPIDIFLNEEDGLCKRFGVDVIRDNYNLYFLKNPGINRGVRIQYGKNMTGIDFTTSDDEVATRIVPVGEKEDGTKLYLGDSIAFPGTLQYGSRGNTVKELQSRLVSLGYSVGSTGIDGIFEWRTENGLNAFKADAGLPENGIYDEETHKALMEALGITSEPYIDSEHINDYPIIHVYELQCENCTVGTEEDGGGKVTEEVARARMREQAEKLLENGCDQPKIEMSVEFINLGDTEEYKQFRNLENCFLYDYVIVQHPTMDIDVTAQIMEIEWDCLLDRMVSVEIGSVGKTLANTGITSWQIPNGFSGSKIAGGTISGGALQSDIISVRHMQAESINTEALQAACVTAVKIAAGAIEATHISVEAIDAVLANIDTAVIEKAEIDWAEIASLAAEIANIAKAQITEANIDQANINWANIANLSSAVADIAKAVIDEAVITSAQIDDLNAVVAEIIHAQVATGDFSLAEIENLLASAFILEQGSAGSMTITNLIVTQANMLGAVIQNLVIPGTDGKYYEIVVGTDGNLSTEEVTVTEGEIEAGELDDGRQIVTTTVNAESINGTSITAQQAILNTILTQALTAGQITAGEALIASATIPTLYTTSIEAIGNSLTFSANEKIQMIVSNLNGTTEDLTAYIAATNAELENLQGQIDGAITTWFYEVPPENTNPPASEWTTTEQKNIHLGDLYYDTITGYCYRWQVQNNAYGWQRITDTDVTKALSDAAAAQDTADSKRRVFVSTPVPPYDVGDLWTQGAAGEILRCQTAKTGQQSYAAGDWVKASKYTDDAKAEAVEAELEAQVNILEGKIELRATKTEVEAAQSAADAAQSEAEFAAPYISGTPPEEPPEAGKMWVDTGVSPEVWRRWRGADVPTEREYTETRVGCGKNLLNDASIVSANTANTTVMIDGHAVRIQGTGATYRSGRTHIYLPAGAYTIKADIAVTSGVARITRRASTDGGRTYPSTTTDGAPSGANGYTFTVERGGEWNRISFYATWATAEDGDVTYSNIRLYAGTDATEFVPYEDIPFLTFDNTQGQALQVEAEVGCDVTSKNMIDINSLTTPVNTSLSVTMDQLRVYTTGDGGTWMGGSTRYFVLQKGVAYTLSAQLVEYVSGDAYIAIRNASDNTIISALSLDFGKTPARMSKTYTPDSNMRVYFTAFCSNNSVLTGDVTYRGIQLEVGDEATAYESYKGLAGKDQISIVACGKNLVDLSSLHITTTNVQMDMSDDSVHVYTTDEGGEWRGINTPVFTIFAGVTYTLSATLSSYASGYARVGLRGADNNTFVSGATLPFNATTGKLSATYTPDADDEVYLSILCTSGTVLTGDCTFSNIQLEVSSATTDYEPYCSLGGGTITSDEPFHGLPGAEDTVEVSTDGDVLVTRRTGVFIADGEQYAPYASTFSTPEGVYAYTAPLTGSGAAHKENFAGMCSHFTVIPRNAVQSERVAGTAMLGLPNSGDGPQAWFFTTQATAEAFNAWLQQQVDAGTPVTLVYELAVPETEALTAVAPIAPQPGQVNILTDADALTATIYGSGWEVVNDTGDLRSGLSEVDSTLAALEEEFGILGNTVAQHAEFIVSPDKIFAQVAEASKYNEQINALRVEIEANTNGITLRKEEIEAVGDRVSNIESGVHIDGSDIGLYSSDSPFETHVTHEGVVISENDMAMITVKENKMTSPRVHATDSLIFGADAAVAFRCINGHFMMLRYGG